MKTPILSFLLTLALCHTTPAHAQWQVIDPQLPDSLDFISWGISVVDENVVWGNPIRNGIIDAEDRYFYKTTDGGQTWMFAAIEEAWSGWWVMNDLFALDANTAWTIRVRFPGQDTSEVLKTVDGGDVWVHQDLPMTYTGLSGIHFVNKNEGMVFGEAHEPGVGPSYPNGWRIEAYYTQDGGDTWLPAAMPESSDEGFIFASGKSSSGSFEALGDCIWFGTSKSRVFYSYDRGKTWSASAPILPGRPIDNVAFRDSLNGIAISAVNDMINTAPKLAFHTADGGKNWTPLPGTNTTWGGWLTDVEYVPGSGGVYWGISQTRTVLSKDNGNTWVQEDTPFLLWFAEFLSPNVGWGGGAVHPTPPTSKLLMYKWIGDSLLRDERINATKTWAGSGIEGYRDGAARAAGFYNPKGMAIDHTGNVYVADDYNHCIRKITPDGQASTLAGTGQPGYADGPGASAQFNRPQDVVLDSGGNLYVADANNYVIRKIAPDGTVSLWAGTPGASGETDGPVFQATFGWPSALSKDEEGNLYVGGSTTIRKISAGGEVSTLYTAASAIPCLDADRYGNVYFADEATLSVSKRRPDGQISVLAGNGSGCTDGIGTTAEFGSIDDLDADDFGAVYVVDGLNASIRKVDSLGNAVTLAGTDCLNPAFLEQQPADGPGELAQLGRLRGILLKPSGNLLVTSWDNDMIREVTLGSGPAKQMVVKSSHISPVYKTTPFAQIQPMAFSGEVLNYGDDPVPGLRLSVSIRKDGANVWQKNAPFITLQPDSLGIMDGSNFKLSSTGVYDVIMDYKQVATSFFSFQEEFAVSDSILAADDGLEYEFDSINGVAAYGQMFHIPVQDTLTGFSLKARLDDASFCFSVYNFNGENPGALIYTSDTLKGVSGNYPYEYYHYLPTSLALPAGNYLFVVSKTDAVGSFGIGVDTDRNDQSAWYRSADQNIPDWTPLYQFWDEQTAPVYMLRPVFGAPALTISDANEEPAQMPLQVQIAPNPVSDQLYVKVQVDWSEQFILQLTDATGRLLLESAVQGGVITAVDVSRLPTGMYGLRVMNSTRVGYGKIIKQ